MTTPVWITGLECGCNPTTNGLGLWQSVNGSPVADSAIKRTGSYSLKLDAPGGGTAYNCRRNNSTNIKQSVIRYYFYIPTGGLPSANTIICGWVPNTAAGTIGLNITTAGVARAQVLSGTAVGSTSLSLDTWHLVDMRVDMSTSTWTLEWYLDGIQQSSAELTGQSTTDTLSGFRFGSASSTVIYKIYFDDIVMSETPADYPIGAGWVEGHLATADGTHNAGTNVIEANDGSDIGVVTAYDKVNSVPTSSTTYIRQAASGTGNYAEVAFRDVSTPNGGIQGAMAYLSYTSATTTSNRGGCIASKDNFSTNTVIFGGPGATADYSDGSTASPWWKSAMIAGVVDEATANAIKIRMGYSDDANPNPYWLDLYVEVAYAESTNIIDLDLVTFSSTVNDITIVENEVIPLDLVTFSSTFPDITITENVDIPLDLVTHSSTIHDITILENEVIPLDLVTFSSSFPDMTVLENVVVPLDLVAYSSMFPDISILENEVIPLDLVTFSSTFPDVTFEENPVTLLDLVSYSIDFPDISITENEVISLDFVSYSVAYPDIELVETEDINLDLVTYSYVFPELTILESVIEPLDLVTYSVSVLDIEILEEGDIALDSVEYLVTVNDLTITEDEIVQLDIVSYSVTFYDIEILEHSIIDLELVIFTSMVNDALIVSPYESLTVPLSRTYSIKQEIRSISIEKEIRNVSVDKEDRTYSIR